jgi:Flp pilus assembly protein TadD
MNPKDPETARLLGVLNMVQGNKDAALEWLQKGEEVAGEDAAALWELGVAYNNLGMSDKARELQQKAYQADPDIVKRVQDAQ